MLSLVHLVKFINKPLYYGFHDKSSNKTNIVYFKNKDDAHKCKVSVNNYYHKYKRSPQIKKLNFNEKKETVVYFKVHSMDEQYMHNYIHRGNLNSCHCIIDNTNSVWCMQVKNDNDYQYTPFFYFNVLYSKAYSKDIYN